MIKIENGTVEFEGTLINLLAEFTELAREFKGLLRKKLGDERSEQEFNKILRIANMSNAELEAEAKESESETWRCAALCGTGCSYLYHAVYGKCDFCLLQLFFAEVWR